jgi:hypothetical protein
LKGAGQSAMTDVVGGALKATAIAQAGIAARGADFGYDMATIVPNSAKKLEMFVDGIGKNPNLSPEERMQAFQTYSKDMAPMEYGIAREVAESGFLSPENAAILASRKERAFAPAMQAQKERDEFYASPDADPTTYSLYQAGNSIDEFAQDALPLSQEDEEAFATQVGRGIGQFGGMAALGALSPALAMGSGVAMNTTGTFEDARASGATPEQQLESASYGVVGGASEVLPIERFLNVATGGKGSSLIKNAIGRVSSSMAKQGTAEALQEIGQTVWNNLIASDFVKYDPERDAFTGTTEAGEVAFTVGALADGIAQMIAGRRGAVSRQKERLTERFSAEPAAEDAAFPEDIALPEADVSTSRQEPFPIAESENPLDQLILGDSARSAKAANAAPITAAPGELQSILDSDSDVISVISQNDGFQLVEELDDAGQPTGEQIWYNPQTESFRPYDAETGGFSEEFSLDEVAERTLESQGTKNAPVAVQEPVDVSIAEQQVNTNPSEAQKIAGNYKKGHMKVAGFDVTIENPLGSTRSGTDENGESWSTTMPATYGYIKRTNGADGDQVDVYVGPAPDSKYAFIVDQVDAKTKQFDEHKVMIGFPNKEAAQATYNAAFNDGKGLERTGSITAIEVPKLKEWIRSGDTTKPYFVRKSAQELETERAAQTEAYNAEIYKRATSRIDEHIADVTSGKDPSALALVHILRSLENKVSRQRFTEVTGVKLPRNKQQASDVIAAWAKTKQPNTNVAPQPAAPKPPASVPNWAEGKTKLQWQNKLRSLKAKKTPTEEDTLLIRDLNARIGSLRANTPRKKRATGTSLLHFIGSQGGAKDFGGDLAAMGAGDWHKGKSFARKVINNETGKSLDDLALLAWEAGYFHNQADVSGKRPSENELKKLIGAELFGNKVETLDKTLDEFDAQEEDPAEREAAIYNRAVELGMPESADFDLDYMMLWIAEKETSIDLQQYSDMIDFVSGRIEEEGFNGPEFSQEQIESDPAFEPTGFYSTEPPYSSPEEGQSPSVSENTPASEQQGETLTEETEAGTQQVIAGAEKISDKKLAERKMQGGKKAKKEQKNPDFGLFDTGAQRQQDIFAQPANPTPSSAKPTPPSAKPTPSSTKQAETPSAPIQDFGEKIGGAKKDLWKERALEVSDLAEIADRELFDVVRKERLFPIPDYEALAKMMDDRVDEALAGTDGEAAKQAMKAVTGDVTPGVLIAYSIKQIRDAIAKPKNGQSRKQLEDYAKAVGALRTTLLDIKGITDLTRILENAFGDDIFNNRRFNAQNEFYPGIRLMGNKFVKAAQISPYDLSWTAKRLTSIAFPRKQEAWEKRYEVIKGTDLSITSGRRRNENDEWVDSYGVYTRGNTIKSFGTRDEAVAHKETLASKWFAIDKKRYGYETFDSREEAIEALKKVLGSKRKGPDRVVVPTLTSISRTGLEDYRKGANVTGEQFMEAFGFRGGEFGNWNTAEDRQQSLNFAYDALMDLASVINVPPRALSLGGKLGIAFGARGKGDAMAHYEPGKVVINLTKMRGAGSLAHEWSHAMDDYFGRLADDSNAFSTKVELQATYGLKKGMGVRDEMVDAWSAIMEAIRYKARTVDEAVEVIQKDVDKSRKYAASWLQEPKSLFDSKATDVQKQKWDEITGALLEQPGDPIHSVNKGRTGMNATFKGLLALQELYKSVRGVKINKRSVDGLVPNLASLNRHQLKIEAVVKSGVGGRGSTEFAREAEKRDKNSGGKAYWATRHEMFARVFSAYVQDKLAEAGAESQYLVNGSDNSGYQTEIGKAFPEGEERSNINLAFDEFFKVLKTKEEGENVVMFSRKDAYAENTSKIKPSEFHDILKGAGYYWRPKAIFSEEQRAIARTIRSTVSRKFGKDVVIRFADNIYDEKGREADGLFTIEDGAKIIALSLDHNSDSPLKIIHHEGVHLLRRLGMITPQEWLRLKAKAESVWMKKYNIRERYEKSFQNLSKELAEDKMIEEAIAEAYAEYSAVGEIEGNALTGIFDRAREFFSNLYDAISNRFGWQTWEDVFDRIEDGEKQTTGRMPMGWSPVNTAPSFSRRNREQVKTEARQRADEGANSVKRWARRQFTKEGLLNSEVFERKLAMDGLLNVGELDIEAMVFDFEKDVEAAYGVPYRKIPASELAKIKQFLAGEDVVIHKRLEKQIKHMRDFLDRSSSRMQDAFSDLMDIGIEKLSEKAQESANLYLATNGASGSLPASLQGLLELTQTLETNKGKYLHRSYQAFDDPDWKDKALRNKKLISNAEGYIQEQNPKLSEEEVTGAVRAILQSAKENGNFASFIQNGAKVGSKDVSILKKRKDVPVEIRELLGEYQDPKVAFIRSAAKMSNYLAGHYFLTSVYRHGLDTYLHRRPTGVFDTKVAAKGNASMNPLDGLYATEDFVQGMEDAAGRSDSSAFMKKIMGLNSMVKYGKTVLSPTTQFRNFMSAAMFTVMNGHFDWSHMSKAFRATRSDLFTNEQEWRNYIRGLVGLGVLHNNPRSEELREAIKDVTDADFYVSGKVNWRPTMKVIQKLYQAGDDFWKIIAFENEKQLMIKHQNMTEEQASKAAAYRVRNGYPTYSMVPRGIQHVRRWILIGTFVSFPWEIARTTKNQIEFIRSDWNAGYKQQAVRRAAGMAITAASAYAISEMTMLMMGIDDDDDEAIRNLAPEWQRNAQLAYLGYDDDGMPIFLDLSHLDPYTYLKKPITALFNGNTDDFSKRILDSMKEILDPFIGVDIAAGTIGDILYNKKDTGGPVYNTEDTLWRQAGDILSHLKKLAPGVVTNIERTVLAISGDSSRSGKQYTLRDEALAWVGFRLTTLNVPQSMIYRGLEFNDRRRDAVSILSRSAGAQNKVSEDELKDAFDSMHSGYQAAFRDMTRLAASAQKLGIQKPELLSIIRASGIGERDANFIVSGRIPSWFPSSQFVLRAKKRAFFSTPNADDRQEVVRTFNDRIRFIKKLASETHNQSTRK